MTSGKTSPLHLEAVVLYAIAFLFLPLATVAPLQLWILAAAGALAILMMRALRGDILGNIPVMLSVLLAAIVAWGALSAIWAVNPDRTLYTAGRLVFVAAGLAILIRSTVSLDADERRRFGAFLVSGAVVGLALTWVLIGTNAIFPTWSGDDRLTGKNLGGLTRTASVISILAWPVALAVARHHGQYAWVAVILLSGITLFVLQPIAPLVAFIIGAVAFSVAWISPRWGKLGLSVAFAASVAIIPFLGSIAPVLKDFLIANMAYPGSEVHRLVIWEFASERILDRPLLGWGLDSARVIPDGSEQVFLFRSEGDPVTGSTLALHPHNALIQIWLELGLVGLVLAAGLFAWIVGSLPGSRSDRVGTATMIAVVACAFVVAQLSFGIWQGWWMAVLGLIAVIVTAAIGSEAAPDRTAAAQSRRRTVS